MKFEKSKSAKLLNKIAIVGCILSLIEAIILGFAAAYGYAIGGVENAFAAFFTFAIYAVLIFAVFRGAAEVLERLAVSNDVSEQSLSELKKMNENLLSIRYNDINKMSDTLLAIKSTVSVDAIKSTIGVDAARNAEVVPREPAAPRTPGVCPNCGNVVSPYAKTCSYCETKL